VERLEIGVIDIILGVVQTFAWCGSYGESAAFCYRVGLRVGGTAFLLLFLIP
jgi:glutaminase